ncbi:MAG: hypothetical protein HLUCCX14_14110 [Marinobacter excellens HL-55]|uniref:Uncharacterized protein n=1 Tax=Marinobacter excellens HL-55 TaxID=1305731 RepID=A0A0P8BH21_9GAMM|nr:MAG: hypothetical protein HLUCCX14_14110 [Marinobacter excellens HL-55]
MAVHDKTREMLPKRFQSFSDQDLLWLWSVLGRDFAISHPESFKNPLGLAESCAKAIENRDEAYADWVFNYYQQHVVNYEMSGIIGNAGKRLISFLMYKLVVDNGFDFDLGSLKYYLDDRSCFLLAVDLDTRLGSDKLRIVRDLTSIWNLRMLKDYSLDWVDGNNSEQVSWLINEGLNAGLPSLVPGSVNNPLSINESLLKFRCMLDQSSLNPKMEEMLIRDLRRKWSIKTNKKRNERCQVNVLLLPETKEGIKELMRRDGYKTQGELVDALVSKALSDEKGFL